MGLKEEIKKVHFFMKRREESYLVDHGDDGLKDLALERAEDHGLILDGEGDEASALADEPLPDVLHPRDGHHEPVPPTAPTTTTSAITNATAGFRWIDRSKGLILGKSSQRKDISISLSKICIPAGALDVLHKLGDELVAEVGTEVTWVELHVALQSYVEEHLSLSRSPN